jgi:hypothetical protein
MVLFHLPMVPSGLSRVTSGTPKVMVALSRVTRALSDAGAGSFTRARRDLQRSSIDLVSPQQLEECCERFVAPQ